MTAFASFVPPPILRPPRNEYKSFFTMDAMTDCSFSVAALSLRAVVVLVASVLAEGLFDLRCGRITDALEAGQLLALAILAQLAVGRDRRVGCGECSVAGKVFRQFAAQRLGLLLAGNGSPLVISAIEAMPPPSSSFPAWRFLRARVS